MGVIPQMAFPFVVTGLQLGDQGGLASQCASVNPPIPTSTGLGLLVYTTTLDILTWAWGVESRSSCLLGMHCID